MTYLWWLLMMTLMQRVGEVYTWVCTLHSPTSIQLLWSTPLRRLKRVLLSEIITILHQGMVLMGILMKHCQHLYSSCNYRRKALVINERIVYMGLALLIMGISLQLDLIITTSHPQELCKNHRNWLKVSGRSSKRCNIYSCSKVSLNINGI